MTIKKPIIIQTVFLLAIIAGGIYLFQGRNSALPKTEDKPNKSAETTLPNTAEDLLKQTARTEINPQNTDKVAKVTYDPPKEICVNDYNYSCYEDHYKLLVKAKGVTAAFDDLKARYDSNSYIKSQCHPLTHTIGNAAVELYPDVGQAYAKGDSVCWSGYYHGVMEGIIGRISPQDLPNKMNGICANIQGKAVYSFDYYNCVHGIGHGVMAISQDELFDSLKLCDNLQGGWEQSSCHGGVFMENVIVDNKNHFTKYLKPSEPLYPCTAVDDKYKTTCYLMQTSYMLKVTNSDFSKVFELCSTVGSFAATCYQSLGRDASGRSISDVQQTKATCELGKDNDQRSNCIIGAVKDFVSYHHSDVQAKQLCGAIATEIQSVCFSTVESYYKSF
ncbi:MAG: hypothetical protein KW804_02890 [Candidatus Doudnabacteria bacterium]|nr:hypothetical protein [Candidatus Doudnabacteria bacterium]